MLPLSRRYVLGLGAGVLGATLLRDARAADADAGVHGLSVFGDLKYPADFQHFDYVNPVAPKGGTFSTIPALRAYNQSFLTIN
jgi:microcin C transport system substrate-binding protein